MPTAESSALDTTTGMSICAAIPSMCRTPPSGATFSTAMSAAPERTTCSGSSALRMLSSAAIGHVDAAAHLGQFGHRRARLFEVLQRSVGGQRLGRRDGLLDAPAAVGVDPHGRHLRRAPR